MPTLQLDGLVGPSHHYAGLSSGNVASQRYAHCVSNPREAALQGLEKMRYVTSLGAPQMVMPPVMHEVSALLHSYGFGGETSVQFDTAYRLAPNLLASVFSASSMWVANAATVTAGADSADGRVHFTPANLVSKLHRSQEPKHTASFLRQLFPDTTHFAHHAPLAASAMLSDEGAANHMRLAPSVNESEDKAGVNLFVYGVEEGQAVETQKYSPRQHKLACESIARQHGWKEGAFLLLKQSPLAVDAGVFHNDVIALSGGHFLCYHEAAYTSESEVALGQFAERYADWPLMLRRVSEAELPLKEAVQSYFFNSQLVQREDGIHIIAPSECEENAAAKQLFERLVSEENPVVSVTYLNLRESMQNGGGPACLRLRVPLNEAQLAAVHQPAMFDEPLYMKLCEWVKTHYRDRLSVDDFRDPKMVEEMRAAKLALAEILTLRYSEE